MLFLQAQENENVAGNMKENNEDILHLVRIFVCICIYVMKQGET